MFIILFRDPIYNYRTTLLQYAINHVFFMKTFRITPKRTGKKTFERIAEHTDMHVVV